MIPGEYSQWSATLTIPCAYGGAYEMLTMTSDEAQQAQDVVLGMFLVSSHPATI
jgi:hypothetical protein